MACPASKKPKRAPRASSEETETVDVESVESPSRLKLCIICGNRASSKITKDNNFDAMMQLYWCTLGVDVKPIDCNKSDVCSECFDKVLKYFETNDIIVYFETYFKSMRLELLRKNLKGIEIWEKEKRPLNHVHLKIKQKYGGDEPIITEQEEEQIRQTLGGYKLLQDSITENGESKLKLRKNSDDANRDTDKKDNRKQLPSKILKTKKSNKVTRDISDSDSSDSD